MVLCGLLCRDRWGDHHVLGWEHHRRAEHLVADHQRPAHVAGRRLTGEQLNARHTQIAWAGITLSDGYHYSSNNWPGMESMYFRAWAVNRCYNVACTPTTAQPTPNPAWNFSAYSPKIVVINLGTNDWNLGVPGTTFQSKYTTFLQNVRAKHPDAEIFVMRTFNGHLVAETQAAVAARVSAGDTKLHYIDTTGWLIPNPSADFADGFHPNDNGYQKVRDRLVPILQPYLATVATLNDSQFSYDSTGNWPYGWQSGAYKNDNHWSNTAGAFYQVPFNGTQVKLYGARAPAHGIAAVSIDNGAESSIDTYAATRADGVLLWTSPALTARGSAGHQMYIKDYGGAQLATTMQASSTYTQLVITSINVSNGSAEIGFLSSDPVGNAWLNVDDVMFYKQ